MTEAAAHIRRLFLDPKDTYSDVEAAEILGMEPLDLKRRIESGEVEGVRTCRCMTVSRKELIAFALNFRPQNAIEKALGDDLAKALPNSSALPQSKSTSHASKSWRCNDSRSATASPSTPSSGSNYSTSSPRSRISWRLRSRASPPLFAGVDRLVALWAGIPPFEEGRVRKLGARSVGAVGACVAIWSPVAANNAHRRRAIAASGDGADRG